jgi:CRP-like cAMP-binding protein
MDYEKDFVKRFFQPGVSQPDKLEIIASHFHEKVIAKNDHLLLEGKTSQEYMLLENGFMRAYSLNTGGNEVTTAFYSTGQPVFDVASFFMQSMITETAEKRYATLLQANPEIFRQAPLKHIASYLGVTDTSLSRIRRELSKQHKD